MKLGFFVTNQYLPGESMPQKIQDSAEQVRAARDAGFSLIATGQHYLAAPYQMLFSFAEIVSYISQQVTLRPGDLVFSGSTGVTVALKPGDKVDVEIPSIGVLKNTVKAEAA